MFKLLYVPALWLMFVGFIAVDCCADGLQTQLIGMDIIEFSWSDIDENFPNQGFVLDLSTIQRYDPIDKSSLQFRSPITISPATRRYRIQIDRLHDAPMTIYRLRVREQGKLEEIGLAAVMIYRRPERIIPLPFEPQNPTMSEAFSDLWRRGINLFRYYDDQPLSANDPAFTGMAVYVEKPLEEEIVLTGSIPESIDVHFPVSKLTGFAYPLLMDPVLFDSLLRQYPGLEGSKVYLDSNAHQLSKTSKMEWGWHIYAFHPECELDLQLPDTSLVLGDHSRSSVFLINQKKPLHKTHSRDNNVRIIYDPSYETARYKCWENGYSGPWDGITDTFPGVDEVINAGVIRQGKTVYVTDSGITSSTPVSVWGPAPPGFARVIQNIPIGWSDVKQAATFDFPVDIPIGDYRVQVGLDPQNFCTIYVLFDISLFSDVIGGPFNNTEMASWAYTDIPYTGNGRDGYGSEYDYLNYQFWGPTSGPGSTHIYGYRGATDVELGRDGGCFGQRTVELFSSIHGWGAKTPLDAAIHCYQIIGQRLTWGMSPYYGEYSGYYNYHDRVFAGEMIYSIGGSHTSDELDVCTAEQAALGSGFTNRLPASYIYDCGQCMNFGALQAHCLRSIGIPATIHYAAAGAGWWFSFHVWTNAAFLGESSTPSNWGGIWYKMDPCDVYYSSYAAHLEGHIGPVMFDGFGDYVLNTYEDRDGPGYRGRFDLNEADWGSSYSLHADSILLNAPTGDPHGTDLEHYLGQTSCPWGVYDAFADASGTSQSPYQYVIPGDHGYALNDTMWRDNGIAYDPAFDDAENLTALMPGETVTGIIGGWGTAWFRLPARGEDTIEFEVTEGADLIKIYGRWIQPLTSTQSRHTGLLYDFGPVTEYTSSVAGGQLYILVQGEDNSGVPLGSQQVVRFSIYRTNFNQVPALSAFTIAVLIVFLSLTMFLKNKKKRVTPYAIND